MQFLSTVSILIPLVDCSQASLYFDLNESEALICEQTAQFEDFVLQFIDRIILLIENSSMENTRMEHAFNSEQTLRSKLESISEALIHNAGHSILGQVKALNYYIFYYYI